MIMVYEYRCPECDRIIEDSNFKASIQCVCKKKNPPYMQRVYSIGGVTFRGSGFYKTDKD